MHIRVRNQVAQLIRTTYDPESKKGKNTILGRVKLSKPELGAELRQILTPDEQAQFEVWRSSQARISQIRSQLTALELADAISEAVRWLLENREQPDALVAASRIQGEMQRLRNALKKFALPE